MQQGVTRRIEYDSYVLWLKEFYHYQRGIIVE